MINFRWLGLTLFVAAVPLSVYSQAEPLPEQFRANDSPKLPPGLHPR